MHLTTRTRHRSAARSASSPSSSPCSSLARLLLGRQGADDGGSTSGAAKEGGTLQVGTTVDLVPAAIFTNSNDTINDVIGQVYDSLIDYPTDSLEPAAQPRRRRGSSAKDGLSLTLDLRDDVKFHTGRPFTSKDVEFSIKTWADPKWTVQFQRTAAAITGFDTSDPQQRSC